MAAPTETRVRSESQAELVQPVWQTQLEDLRMLTRRDQCISPHGVLLLVEKILTAQNLPQHILTELLDIWKNHGLEHISYSSMYARIQGRIFTGH